MNIHYIHNIFRKLRNYTRRGLKLKLAICFTTIPALLMDTRRAPTSAASTEPTVRTRSSESNVFCLQTHCFYCGLKVSDHYRDHKVKKCVKTLECKLSVDQAIAKRPADDPWSVEVS